MTVYSPASRSVKAYAPSSPVVAVATTLPAASTSVTRASASGPCGRPHDTLEPSARDAARPRPGSPRWPPTSTGRARGRYPAAFTATVTAPGTSSAKENSPCSPADAGGQHVPAHVGDDDHRVLDRAAGLGGPHQSAQAAGAAQQDVVRHRLVAHDHRGRLRLEAVGRGDQHVRAGARRVQPRSEPSAWATERPSCRPASEISVTAARGTGAPSAPRTKPRTGTPAAPLGTGDRGHRREPLRALGPGPSAAESATAQLGTCASAGAAPAGSPRLGRSLRRLGRGRLVPGLLRGRLRECALRPQRDLLDEQRDEEGEQRQCRRDQEDVGDAVAVRALHDGAQRRGQLVHVRDAAGAGTRGQWTAYLGPRSARPSLT